MLRSLTHWLTYDMRPGLVLAVQLSPASPCFEFRPVNSLQVCRFIANSRAYLLLRFLWMLCFFPLYFLSFVNLLPLAILFRVLIFVTIFIEFVRFDRTLLWWLLRTFEAWILFLSAVIVEVNWARKPSLLYHTDDIAFGFISLFMCVLDAGVSYSISFKRVFLLCLTVYYGQLRLRMHVADEFNPMLCTSFSETCLEWASLAQSASTALFLFAAKMFLCSVCFPGRFLLLKSAMCVVPTLAVQLQPLLSFSEEP